MINTQFRLSVMAFYNGTGVDDLIKAYPELKHVIRYDKGLQAWVVYNDLEPYYLDLGDWLVICPNIACEVQEDLYRYGDPITCTNDEYMKLFDQDCN